MNDQTKCKYCHGTAVIKFGVRDSKQQYWCKVCRRKFSNPELPHKAQTDKRILASALSCYFGGMPLDSIQRHLQQQYGVYYSEAGIYKWVLRWSKEAVKKTSKFTPKVGDTWIADETVLKVGGRKIWFWDIIDRDSRFLIATYASRTRKTKDARILMEKAFVKAGKMPKEVITDRLASYLDGVELTFGNNTKHIQSRPFQDGVSTQMIERFHGTLKDRINVVRGFGNMKTTRLLTDAWLVHYNYFKEHESLGNIPPAQLMGNTPVKDWNDVLGAKSKAVYFKPVIDLKLPKKRRTQRRKPKRVRNKEYTQATLKGIR